MKRLDRRVLLAAAVIVVVLGAAEATRRRRRTGTALDVSKGPAFAGRAAPDPTRQVYAGPPVAAPDPAAPLTLAAGSLAAGLRSGVAAVPVDAPVIAAGDDLDPLGAGLPVPAAQAMEELRVENRFETVVFVRAMLILVGIAALLTARAIWV